MLMVTDSRVLELRRRLIKLDTNSDCVTASLRQRLAQLRGLPENDPGRDPEKIRQCERALADTCRTTLNGQLVGVERALREAQEDRDTKLAAGRRRLAEAQTALESAGDASDLDNLLEQLLALTSRCKSLQAAVEGVDAARSDQANVEGDTRGLDKLAASVETLREKIRQRDAEREAITRELRELGVDVEPGPGPVKPIGKATKRT